MSASAPAPRAQRGILACAGGTLAPRAPPAPSRRVHRARARARVRLEGLSVPHTARHGAARPPRGRSTCAPGREEGLYVVQRPTRSRPACSARAWWACSGAPLGPRGWYPADSSRRPVVPGGAGGGAEGCSGASAADERGGAAAGAGGGAHAAQGRQQGGLLRREPQVWRVKALRGAVLSRWRAGLPGLLRHRRGGGAVHRTVAGGPGGGEEACSGAAAAARFAAACPSGDRATHSAASSAEAK